jgi:Queuosine salvage protein
MTPRVNQAGSVFDRIRAAAAAVAESATHVRIDQQGLDALAERLTDETSDDDPGHERVGDDETAAAFVVTLDALNFGSGYFPYIRKRPGHSGYHTIAAAMRDYFDLAGAPTAARLRTITTEECAAIFGQPLDERRPRELMNHFAVALNDLGNFVERVGHGRFLEVVAAAENRAERLVGLLAEMRYYRDAPRYRGREVPIYKRAQITAFDLAVALGRAGPGQFDDLDQLTMFADNLVPHVLRIEGGLHFSDELVARIDAQEDITSGSEPEVEIRACGLHAVELLTARMSALGRPTTAGQLDGELWRMGARPAYKSVRRHRTRCVYY